MNIMILKIKIKYLFIQKILKIFKEIVFVTLILKISNIFKENIKLYFNK